MTVVSYGLPIVGKWAEWRDAELCADGLRYGALGNDECDGGCWYDDPDNCWCVCHLEVGSNVLPPRPIITITPSRGRL